MLSKADLDAFGIDPYSPEAYKSWQPTFAKYLDHPRHIREQYTITGLATEAGEVLALVQKAIRKREHIAREKVLDELGDTFWYLNAVMNEFNIQYEELIKYNIEKLTERNK